MYIQISPTRDAKAFLILARSGFPLVCLPKNTYGVRLEHLSLLKKRRIPFKLMNPSKISLPESALAV
jgi:hypothetical protein